MDLQSPYQAAGSLKNGHLVAIHILLPSTSPPFYGLCSQQVHARPAALATELDADAACQRCLAQYLRNTLPSGWEPDDDVW